LNINNDELIKRDFIFLTWEVFGWVSSYCQKVFLWNVISDNWRIPMLKKHFESSKNENMKMFWIPIRKKWQITWNRFVATNEEAKKLNKNIKDPKAQYISLEQKRIDQGTIWFNQNFNLIPYKKGSRIIKESDIKHYWTLPNNYKVTFWIDPAFSLKTGSDPIWLWITAQERRDNNIFYYVLELRKFAWEEKEENRFCDVIVDLYHKYSCSMIYIEGNNGWEILARMLKRRWLAVTVISTSKDKVTRVVERQWAFERGDIKFNPDNLKVGEGIEQLINFPNVEHDDIVDWLINSLTPYQGGNIRLI
jgi:phage terminase large subunit-like protein